jgi:hypothetical protein
MKIITATTPTVVAQARRLHQRLHIHGGEHRPSAATFNPPTSSTARPATPTFDDCVPFPTHDDVRFAPTPSAPPPPPFSPLDMHPHRSHLASPQTPHLAPPPLPAPPALKRTRPDSPPPASHPPHDAIRTDAASAESLEAHDATERETKKPRHQDGHSDDTSIGMPMAKANTAHDHEDALITDQCREKKTA